MSKAEIINKIDRIETALWHEEMASFMNWNRYNRLKKELAELKKMLDKAN